MAGPLNGTGGGARCDVADRGRAADSLPLVVVVGLLLGVQGICKALRSPLVLVYIDNNVPHRAKTGLYVGQ